jgi:dTDP-4-dehydrorhamnose 3,5-epimerase
MAPIRVWAGRRGGRVIVSAVSTEPAKDTATVLASGVSVEALPHGVTVRRTTTHVDERGTVCELFDPRWQWHPDPLVFAYMFTLRPGKAKGWGLHKLHDDRYVLMSGELLLVLYDVRPDSPTRGLVSKIVLSTYDRRLINIPAGVWHANWNIGREDVVVVNFPTRPYDHENPDKFRLPLDTPEIPFRFDDGPGR